MADIYIQDADGENSDEGVGSDMQQEDGEGDGGGGNQYDFLPPLLRLEKHAASDDIFHRQLVGRLVLETLPHVADSAADVAAVMAVAFRLADDTDAPVRAELMEQVPHIAMLCHEDRDRLYHVVADHLLPLVIRFLSDTDSQVRKMSHAALLVMMEQGLVELTAVERQVCPVVVMLTQLEGLVEYHTGAIALMAKMAPLLGGPKTEQLFIPRFVELCSDHVFYVRRACAANIGDLCAVVGTQATEKLLLSRFVELCKDDIWGVRKACAEVAMSVSCMCSMGARRQVLAPAFTALLADTSRWVRTFAFTTLGPLISTFAEPRIASLAYNQQRDLVVVNPDGLEFRLCTSKGGDEVIVKYIDGSQPFNLNYKYSFSEESPGNLSVINKECDTEDRTGIGGPDGDKAPPTLPSYEAERSAEKTSDVHADSFNTFQYWRVPIPDVSLDAAVGTATTCAAKLDVNMDIDHDLDRLATDLESGAGQVRKSPGVKATDVGSRFQSAMQREVQDWWRDVDVKEGGGERWDRGAARNPAGRTTPSQETVPQALLDHYVTMTHVAQAQATDNEIAHHCAFSFPAVMATLGPANWPLLRDTYEALASDMQWKVRRTVASSIHEVAVILGEELATKDLVPIFNGFIKDLDEVRIGALKHLSDFFKLLRPSQRNSYLPRLQEFMLTDNEWNWRFREELARQLFLSVELFSPSDARRFFMPLGLSLLADKVSAVRHMALNMVNSVVSHVGAERSLARGVMTELAQQFAHSTRWSRRQMFALLCARLVTQAALEEEEFARDVLPHLLDLSWDAVPNVRLAVARTLASPIMDNKYFVSEDSPHSDLMLQVMKRLQHDIDRDVRSFALSASPRVTSEPDTSLP